MRGEESSAGNTRGLIEAHRGRQPPARLTRLPRGIPAASLKRLLDGYAALRAQLSSAGNTRGLIEAPGCKRSPSEKGRSSAGNTRGLIEAL